MGIVVEFHAVAPKDLDAHRNDLVDGGAKQAKADGVEAGIHFYAHIITADLARRQGLLLKSVPVNSLASRALWELLADVGIDLSADKAADCSGMVLDQPLIDRLLDVTASSVERPDSANPVAEAIGQAVREAVEEATWKGSLLALVVS